MSKRLQVVLDESEFRDLQRVARREGLTLSQWVRQALRLVRRQEPVHDTSRKLDVLRQAVRHDFPSGDVDQILAEIESGYVGRPAPASRRRVSEPKRR
jgi:hypothetical protein